jgi:hypothetical protein
MQWIGRTLLRHSIATTVMAERIRLAIRARLAWLTGLAGLRQAIGSDLTSDCQQQRCADQLLERHGFVPSV